MRSLFAKIFLWFAASTFIVVAAIILTSAFFYDPNGKRKSPVSMLLNFQMAEAQHALETGGEPALQGVLDRIRAEVQSEPIFTDAEGRDLLSGLVRTDLIEQGRERLTNPLARLRGDLYARQSPDGKHWLFLVGGRSSTLLWYTQPENLWVWGIVALLCYGLTLHLTRPLKKLQKAVDAFGHGDLTARADEGRADEIGQLAVAFNRMADRIETLRASEKRLLLDVSHELRSPLARLNVALELARQGGANSALDRIEREAERLNTLVSELLDVTRTRSEREEERRELVRLDELVHRLADDCAIEAESRGCRLEMEAGGPVTVKGDPELLRRAVENVVRNAIRYAPEGSPVQLRVANGSGRATVAVRDFGPGVPPESLPHLFDAFYRVDTDRNRSSGGVGLGLSIARRAVELHHGKMRASNASPGLLVEIELPA
jgi:two-component system sensor histidine kinase CpxA